jgi:large subunit ribosomal protein L19
MNQKLLDFNQTLKRTDIPEIQTGDIVRVHKKIKEGDKERVQIIKGLVISIKGKQSSSPTITVRRDGVEMIFPIYLPTIEKIEILRHSKIRRSKLYYMRERSGKSAKMKIKDFSEKEKTAIKEETNKLKQEKEESKKKSQAKQKEKEAEKKSSKEQTAKKK